MIRGAGKGRAGFRLVFLLFACLLASWAYAHPANVAVAQIKVQPDGTFVARVRFDVAAFATNATPLRADDDAMNGLLDGPDEALKAALAESEARFRKGFAAQGGGTLDRVAYPTVEDVRRYLASNPEPRIPAMLTTVVEGHLPKGARTVAFRYPDAIDTVIQTVEFPYKEPASEPVEAGRFSSTLTIPTPEEVARLAAAMNAPRKPVAKAGPVVIASKPKAPAAGKPSTKPLLSKQVASPSLEGEGRVGVVSNKGAGVASSAKVKAEESKNTAATPPKTEPTPQTASVRAKASPLTEKPKIQESSAPANPPSALAPPPSSASPLSPILIYLRMGFTHILPQGLDHILFVLGLFLLGSTTKALLKQITAFTVAHSITLALATLNVVRLPGRIIEPLIALSIAFVAIENLTTKEVRPWRTAVVFLFGLVHGMGFAEVFRDAGLSGGGLITALLSFNVGVELGQLSVVAMALLAIGWFRKDSRYRQVVVVPASLIIAGIALFWTVERVVG